MRGQGRPACDTSEQPSPRPLRLPTWRTQRLLPGPIRSLYAPAFGEILLLDFASNSCGRQRGVSRELGGQGPRQGVARIQVHMGGLHPGLENAAGCPDARESLAGLGGSAEAWVYQGKKKKTM